MNTDSNNISNSNINNYNIITGGEIAPMKNTFTFSRRKFHPITKERRDILLQSNDGVIPSPPTHQRQDVAMLQVGNVQENNNGAQDDIDCDNQEEIQHLKKLQKREWNELPWDLFIDEHVPPQKASSFVLKPTKKQMKTQCKSSAMIHPSDSSISPDKSYPSPILNEEEEDELICPSKSSLPTSETAKTFRLTYQQKIEKKNSLEKLKYKGLGSRRTRRHSSMKYSEIYMLSNAIKRKASLKQPSTQMETSPSKPISLTMTSSTISTPSPSYSALIPRSLSHSICSLDSPSYPYAVNSFAGHAQREAIPRSVSVSSYSKGRPLRQSSASSMHSVASSISLKSINSSMLFHGSATQINSSTLSPFNSIASTRKAADTTSHSI